MPERAANAEIVEGFRDGYDLSLPAPGPNRSRSYRHGFMCGRIDKGEVKLRWTADELRKLADEAMDADERVTTAEQP